VKRRVANVVDRSTHVYVDMNFLAKSAGKEDEQVECIGADLFLRRLVINLHPTNLVIIAPGADVFFWEGGEIGCSCDPDRAVFLLFGDTNSDITTGGAVRVDCLEEADPLVCSRSNDASNLLLFQHLLWRFLLGE
jgi:hypothetical protein